MADWWRTFFDDRYRRFWGEYTSQERTDADVAGILRLLARYGVGERARILDLACGDARIAIGLARAGHRVTGLDYSSSQLEAARDRIAAAGVSVHLVEADMRRPPPELGPFDAIVNWFTSFGYFEEPGDDLRVLESIRDMISPGGCLVLETQHRDRVASLATGARRDWEEVDGTLLLIERFFDPVAGRGGERLRFVGPDGSSEERIFHTRLYTATELASLLRAVGLVVEGVFGGTDGEPLRADTRMLIVARREGGA